MDASRRRFVGLCLAAPVLASDGTLSSAQCSDASTAWPSVFPALRQSVHGHPLTYLDSAATTLRPQSVIDALVQYYSLDNANPSRVHTLASRAADHLAAARQAVARFQRRRCVRDRVRSRHDRRRQAPTTECRCSPLCSRGARRWTSRARWTNKGLPSEPATWQRCRFSSASARPKRFAHRRTFIPLCGTSTDWLTRCAESGSEPQDCVVPASQGRVAHLVDVDLGQPVIP